MANVIDLPNNTLFFKIFSDLLVYLPDVFAFPVTFSKCTVCIESVNYWNLVLLGEIKVFLAVCRC